MSQRVLVTAAASGIGLEIARAFSSSGAKVFITDINRDALAAAEKELPGLMSTVCDNSKRSDIEAMVPTAVKALNGIDVLVNNAGISSCTPKRQRHQGNRGACRGCCVRTRFA